MSDPLALIGLGANLGNAQDTLAHAVQAIAALPGTHLLRCSALYRSAPVDAPGPAFLNAVVQVRTALAPEDLLQALQAIEQQAGRTRPFRNAPRTLDLDVLDVDGQKLSSPTLQLPHPRMHERRFVLAPLLDCAPDHAVPGRGPARELAAGVAQQAIERLMDAPAWTEPRATEANPAACSTGTTA